MKRVACYVRANTEGQNSIDNQISSLEEYCKENNYTIAGIYKDSGISARKSYKERPALLQLIEDCKNGKIDLIIFTKLDRLSRNVRDYYELQRVLDKYDVEWFCLGGDLE